MSKRKKFRSALKTKMVLECFNERYSIQELAGKHEHHPSQISQWKNQFLANIEVVFEKGIAEKSKEETEQEKL